MPFVTVFIVMTIKCILNPYFYYFVFPQLVVKRDFLSAMCAVFLQCWLTSMTSDLKSHAITAI